MLPDDPDWLHEAPTFRLRHRGELVDVFGIGAMARAIHRSPGTVRRLERQGFFPAALGRSYSRSRSGQYRVYTRAQVLKVAQAAHELGIANGRRTNNWKDFAGRLSLLDTDLSLVEEHADQAR